MEEVGEGFFSVFVDVSVIVADAIAFVTKSTGVAAFVVVIVAIFFVFLFSLDEVFGIVNGSKNGARFP